ncbi:MAG: DUF763 domain-containing protein [Planctomyces sp.]|nr:DUF763 domain-containing protein [Planctomyces sp.]
MARRRIAQMPLHGGKAPAYLFRRMTKLAGAITMAIVDEFGPDEVLRRLSDPWWFQAFGCVLGFDWHSSGVTTVTCGALKEASRVMGSDLGIVVAGGKGNVSRKTPTEIIEASDRLGLCSGDHLVRCSKLSAKVDSAAVQDGFNLYHHCFFFTHAGQWCVVQQGMNEAEKSARRYHWLSEGVQDFVCEPHAAISDLAGADSESAQSHDGDADVMNEPLLNMVAFEASGNRNASVQLTAEHPDRILSEIQLMTEGPSLFAPRHHQVLPRNINRARLKQLIPAIHEQMPQSYQELLGLEGVGPAAVRSLALVAEIIFQTPVSHRDPAANPMRESGKVYCEDQEPQQPGLRRWADYSYAHGGKDATPFPVDCESYDRNIQLLTDAIRRARLGENDRFHALRALGTMQSDDYNRP